MPSRAFRDLWQWTSRSVPGLGVAAHLGYREERLRDARAEDAAYRASIEDFGGVPRYPNHSEQRERYLLAGELAGHLVAVTAGVLVYRAYRDALALWWVTWLATFVADWAGGRLGGKLFDVMQTDDGED